MAIASYTTDLTTIATGDLVVDAGTWDESTDAAWDDAGAMVDDQNLYYNNTECVSAQFTKDGVGTIMYVHTAPFTIPADGAALIHHLWAAPPALATLALGGIRVLAGTDLGNFYGWNASGSDFAPAPKGGWTNYAINPAIGTPDYTVGTITTYDMIGMAVSALAQARGNPNACNAIRYGRCEAIFTDGDLANGYATFDGFALVDNISTNRWSLIDPVEGGYKCQGLMSIGTAATAVDFRDANRNLTFANTINVTPAFNAIEINNISSNVEWIAISISALGITSKGTFAVIDNATVTKTSCTFTDMDSFVYQSNSTILNSTYRRCGLVTQGSAIFTSSTFDNPSGTVGVLVNALNNITKCTFNSDGTGHAVDLGIVSADVGVNWDNFESGYAATSGNTGNETILVNVDTGITLTINVQTGASTPSVYNTGAGTVLIVSGAVSINVHVEDQSGVDVVGAFVYIDEDLEVPGSIVNTITNATGDVSTSYSGAATSATVRIRKYGYKPYVGTITLLADSSTNVTLITDPQQI